MIRAPGVGPPVAAVLSRRYVDALRVAQTSAAEQVVDDALAAGLDAAVIQSLIIEPAMERIGRLWEANAITVPDEHLAMAVRHSVLVKLFDRLTVAPPRSRERVLLAAVEGQHHVLGLRMIADVMEGAGFDVLYLGADVPVDALRRFAGEHQPSITGLGFAISLGVGVLAESIHAVHEACRGTQIMLGGRAVPAGLVEAGYTRVDSSMEVLFVAERLLRQPPGLPDPALLQLLRPARHEPRGGREFAQESDAIAERMAEVAEGATSMARDYARRAGTFKGSPLRDLVTDLGSRRAFDDRLRAPRLAPDGGGGALLMIDVDGFKAINDTRGHTAGDALLRRIGSIAANASRSHDFIARVGGDEFAVLLDRARPVKSRARVSVPKRARPSTMSCGGPRSQCRPCRSPDRRAARGAHRDDRNPFSEHPPQAAHVRHHARGRHCPGSRHHRVTHFQKIGHLTDG